MQNFTCPNCKATITPPENPLPMFEKFTPLYIVLGYDCPKCGRRHESTFGERKRKQLQNNGNSGKS